MNIFIMWSTFLDIYSIRIKSSLFRMLFRSSGSAIFAHSITKSIIISILNRGFQEQLMQLTVFNAKNLSFFFTCLDCDFSMISMATLDQWQPMLLDWNMILSVFYMLSSIGVMYLTMMSPLFEKYSIENQFLQPIGLFLVYMFCGANLIQLFRASSTIFCINRSLNSINGFSQIITLQIYFWSWVETFSIYPSIGFLLFLFMPSYFIRKLYLSLASLTPSPSCSFKDCSIVTILNFSRIKKKSSMIFQVYSIWVYKCLMFLTEIKFFYIFEISAKMYLLGLFLMEEKIELFMALTNNEFYLNISVSSKVKMMILGCLMSISLGLRKLTITCSSVANCLMQSFYWGCFTLSLCVFTRSNSLAIMFGKRQLYQFTSPVNSYFLKQLSMTLCSYGFKVKNYFSKMNSMHISEQSYFLWGCRQQILSLMQTLVFLTWQVKSRQEIWTMSEAMDLRSSMTFSCRYWRRYLLETYLTK